MNCKECKVLSVKTSISLLVSTACTNVEPPPILIKSAVFCSVGKKSVGSSLVECLINNGS